MAGVEVLFEPWSVHQATVASAKLNGINIIKQKGDRSQYVHFFFELSTELHCFAFFDPLE